MNLYAIKIGVLLVAIFLTGCGTIMCPLRTSCSSSGGSSFFLGILDTAFGLNGTTITDLSGTTDHGYDITTDNFGRILVAGSTASDFVVARYSADGVLDSSFGTSGYTSTDFAADIDHCYNIKLQSSGKIILAGGRISAGFYDFALARYTSNGILDTTFGTGGRTTTDFAGNSETVYDMVVLSNDKIIVVGYTAAATENFAMARYSPDGILDTTFGSAGITTTDFSATNDRALAIQVYSNGKILVAGHTIGTLFDFALARYTSDGILDTTFGTAGMTTTDFAANWDRINDIILTPDEKIIAVGSARVPSQGFAVARYTTDGILDTTFGTAGLTTTTFAFNNPGTTINSVALQNDGKIVVAGNAPVGFANLDFTLARYTSNGILDTTFGTAGLITTNISSSNDLIYSMILQSDNRILVGGETTFGTGDIVLARYK